MAKLLHLHDGRSVSDYGFAPIVGNSFSKLLPTLVLFEIVFYLTYRFGMSFSEASVSSFWFPDTVLLCALLVVRPNWWWLFILAPLPIRLTVAVPVDTPLWFLLAAFVIDSAKGLATALLLRWLLKNPIRFGSGQKQAVTQALQESERRFRHMADSAPALIWMSGTDNQCEFVNKAWLNFTGTTFEQAIEDGLAERIHPGDRGHSNAVSNTAFEAQEPFELECRLRDSGDKYHWILSNVVPRYAQNGEFQGYIGSAIDISERKRAEEISQNIAHVSRLAVVGELTAMIAHEVNQPLGAILSNAEAAELLLETAEPPLQEIREILADIRKNDLRADEAIKRIRALLSKREMQLGPLDMNLAVADVICLVSGDVLHRRVQLYKEFSPDLPLVLGDKVYLQQVLLNLIVNAMDAMNEVPEGARKLTVRTKMGDESHVDIEVCDNGQGIALDAMPSIFKSFFTTKKEGVGLGLSISNSIIEMHAGKLVAENNLDEGATFRIRIPLANIKSGWQADSQEDRG